MSSLTCPPFQSMTVCKWRHTSKNFKFWVLLHSKRHHIIHCTPLTISCSVNDDSISPIPNNKQSQLGYDPSEELYGLSVDLQPKKDPSSASALRSWFGPNGQYIKELPCPSCRGRGYTPCTRCGIEMSRLDCSECNGKGMVICNQCLGECVIWEETIDEQPWEKARSISPLKVKEDDEVDNLEIKSAVRRKSKRIYQSTSPEVALKISRTLKTLNAKTGLFTKRMKLIHQDPELRAQRAAAIKKVKGTADARKHASESMKAFFSDPENRRRRSISMKGVNFYCKNCGREGHRRHYCPELELAPEDRQFRCRLCGEKGHNRRTCPKHKPVHSLKGERGHNRPFRCGLCGEKGHNRRSCPKHKPIQLLNGEKGHKRRFRCGLCGEKGHNRRSCPKHKPIQLLKGEKGHNRQFRCGLCGEKGHNRRSCLKLEPIQILRGEKAHKRRVTCSLCGEQDHNRRSCPKHKPIQFLKGEKGHKRPLTCSLCGEKGHNRRSCPKHKPVQLLNGEKDHKRWFRCGLCGEKGHNRRSCQNINQSNS